MAMNIRKASCGYRGSENFKNDSAVAFEKSGGTNGATERPKSKVETIRNLGFSKKQVERFETLADNKDLVEKEKAQAREEGRMPTRTRVIDMAQARKKSFEQNREQIDADAKIAKDFVRATHAPLMFSDDLDAVAAAIWRNADGDAQSDIEDIDLAIRVLSAIKMRLMQGRKLYGSA